MIIFVVIIKVAKGQGGGGCKKGVFCTGFAEISGYNLRNHVLRY